jgi:FKBP-type peptidyl-prolyl cis-trans isomerase
VRPGDEWDIYVPLELAYGWVGKEPAGRTLIIKIEVLEVVDIEA